MKKGFTLVELLIVIGILAILTAAVVVVLNPAELLKQARDAQRFSDLDSVKSAISLYLATVSSPELGETAYCNVGTVFGTTGTTTCATSTSTAVDGTGWVGVNISAASGGSPLASLPFDPVNNATYRYAYDGVNSAATFELNCALESTKYATTEDLDGKDGGNDDDLYETGTDPGLDLGD